MSDGGSDRTVLVLDGQLRSALAVVRSLGRHGVRVVCGEASRVSTACYSKYVDERVVYPDPEREPAAFVGYVVAYLARHDVDVVLPVGHETTRLVSEHRDRISDHAAVAVPDFERFERALDKGATIEAARAADVPHPETIRPDGPEAAAELAADLRFPVVIKPRRGSGSRGLEFVHDEASFAHAYESVHRDYPEPLVQERVPREGAGMGAGILRNRDGETTARFAYKRLREYPPSGGPSTLRESVDRPDVVDAAERLLDELDWTGLAMVEFKEDPRDRTPKLMEVNPRFWGSLHLPLHAGVDFPWLVYKYALDEPADPQLTYDAGVRCRYLLPGDLLHLASVRNRRALGEFFPLRDENLHYDILSRDDPRPTMGRLLAMGRFSLSPRMWRKVILRGGTDAEPTDAGPTDPDPGDSAGAGRGSDAPLQ